MTFRKIISGGQTGADQGALAAARELGLETGGWMPFGWRTETGPRPDLAALYGMQEHWSADYHRRTAFNVRDADATLLFGDAESVGSKRTLLECHQFHKPNLILKWHRGQSVKEWTAVLDYLNGWLNDVPIETLNVAGNRESHAPGIHDACRDFLDPSLERRHRCRSTGRTLARPSAT